jgi:hypothetical protein
MNGCNVLFSHHMWCKIIGIKIKIGNEIKLDHQKDFSSLKGKII